MEDDALSNLTEEMWGPNQPEETPNLDDFFECREKRDGTVQRGKFVPKRMADWIMERTKMKTMGVRGVMYRYRNGVYSPDAEEFILNTAATILAEEYTTKRVSEVLNYIKSQTFSTRDIDADPLVVNVRNGMLNLLTGELAQHDPEIFTTSQIPVEYKIDADCPKVKKFVSEVVKEDDIQIVQEIFGFVLIGDYRIQKAVMLIGDGANGKSTLISLIEKFIGKENVTNTSLQNLTSNDFVRSRLYGKMANMYADLPDQVLRNTGEFKTLTGGDSAYGNVKFKEGFEFMNRAKLIFSCNKLPEAFDETDAFFRRWVFLTFPNRFIGDDCNPNIGKEISTQEELSGVLNWALEGARRLLERGEFSNSKTTEEIREYYERMSSPVNAFIKDSVTEDPEGFVVKKDLYGNFCSYCNENKLPIIAENTFGKHLIQMLGHKIRDAQHTVDGRKGVRCWNGISPTQTTHNTHVKMHCSQNDNLEKYNKWGQACVSCVGREHSMKCIAESFREFWGAKELSDDDIIERALREALVEEVSPGKYIVL